MYIAAILLSLELLVGTLVALPSHDNRPAPLARVGGHVLDDSVTNGDQQPTDTPTQSQDQSSSDQAQDSSSPIDTPTDQQPQDTQSVPTDTPDEQSQAASNSLVAVTPLITQEASAGTSLNQNDITPTVISDAGGNVFQSQANTAVAQLDSQVFADVTEKSPTEQLSDKTVNEVKHQEDQLQNAKTPEEQVSLLNSFESKSIQNINANIKSNQFNDVSYAASRLSYQLDKSADTIQQLPPAQARDYRSKISNMCKNTAYLLRPQQLIVPEDTQQTFEITLGKCFNFVQ